MGSKLDFGGLSVTLCGDFHQLPAVGGSMMGCVINYCTGVADAKGYSSGPIGLLEKNGERLVAQLRLYELVEFQRSKGDKYLGSVLTAMRTTTNPHPVTEELLAKLEELVLTDKDMETDFRHAPIAGTGNSEYHNINYAQIQRHAAAEGRHILQWPNELVGEANEGVFGDDIRKHVPACTEHMWMTEAPVLFIINIAPSISLANGTEAKCGSVLYDDPQKRE